MYCIFATFYLAPSRFLWDHVNMTHSFTLHDLPEGERPRKRRGTATLVRWCNVCGRGISITLKAHRAYSGGHYFGTVPKFSNSEMKKALKAGGRIARIDTRAFQVLNRNPKPHGCFEYWECEGCYRDDASPPSPKNL